MAHDEKSIVGIITAHGQDFPRVIVPAHAEYSRGESVQPQRFTHVGQEGRRYDQIVLDHDDRFVLRKDACDPINHVSGESEMSLSLHDPKLEKPRGGTSNPANFLDQHGLFWIPWSVKKGIQDGVPRTIVRA